MTPAKRGKKPTRAVATIERPAEHLRNVTAVVGPWREQLVEDALVANDDKLLATFSMIERRLQLALAQVEAMQRELDSYEPSDDVHPGTAVSALEEVLLRVENARQAEEAERELIWPELERLDREQRERAATAPNAAGER